MTTLELLTSVDAFDALHEAADSRKGVVRVDRQALLGLLIDHSCMLNALARAAVKVTSPEPKRDREKLK